MNPSKLIKITDQSEDSRDAGMVTHHLHELYKSLKRRAGDVLLLKEILDGSKGQNMEETLNKLDAREIARVKSEDRKIALFEQFVIEDKELKK